MKRRRQKTILVLKTVAAVLICILLVLIGILVLGVKKDAEQSEVSIIDSIVTEESIEKPDAEEEAEAESEEEEEELAEQTEEPSETIFRPDEEHVKPLGRIALQDDTLWLTHSGTGAEFIFNGKKLKITFCGDETAADDYSDPDSQARVAVMVDGECVFDEIMTQPEMCYEQTYEEQSELTVKVVKLSEAINSTVGLKEIETDPEGSITPAKEKDRYIEFIGDSIVCGYGVDDSDPSHKFSTRTENVMKSYAYRTAELLNADYSMVCFSGYGVYSGYVSSTDTINSEETIPHYYDKLAYSRAYYNGKRPQDVSYEETRGADYVVINLGTNDRKYVDGREERKEEFQESYINFLKSVRKHHPGAYIICSLGIMGDELFPEIEKAVQEYTEKTGDKKVSSFRFDLMAPENGYGANGHPSEKNQERAAEQLVKYIDTLP